MQSKLPMHLSLRCGARTRSSPCRSPAMPNGRCRMHGGGSPGAPKGNQVRIQAWTLLRRGNCLTAGGRGACALDARAGQQHGKAGIALTCQFASAPIQHHGSRDSRNGKQLIRSRTKPFSPLGQRAHASHALLLSFLACSLFAVGAAQAAPPDPARLVASIYADGREGAVWSQWLDGKRRGEWFSHALTARWATCDMRAHTINDELGALDFDVATNSQGLEVKSFTVKTLSRDASHATVVANLTPDNWVRTVGSRERDPLRPRVGARPLERSTTSIP